MKMFETEQQAKKRHKQEKKREIRAKISAYPNIVPLYERDYMLSAVNGQFLFHEYLEMGKDLLGKTCFRRCSFESF